MTHGNVALAGHHTPPFAGTAAGGGRLATAAPGCWRCPRRCPQPARSWNVSLQALCCNRFAVRTMAGGAAAAAAADALPKHRASTAVSTDMCGLRPEGRCMGWHCLVQHHHACCWCQCKAAVPGPLQQSSRLLGNTGPQLMLPTTVYNPAPTPRRLTVSVCHLLLLSRSTYHPSFSCCTACNCCAMAPTRSCKPVPTVSYSMRCPCPNVHRQPDSTQAGPTLTMCGTLKLHSPMCPTSPSSRISCNGAGMAGSCFVARWPGRQLTEHRWLVAATACHKTGESCNIWHRRRVTSGSREALNNIHGRQQHEVGHCCRCPVRHVRHVWQQARLTDTGYHPTQPQQLHEQPDLNTPTQTPVGLERARTVVDQICVPRNANPLPRAPTGSQLGTSHSHRHPLPQPMTIRGFHPTHRQPLEHVQPLPVAAGVRPLQLHQVQPLPAQARQGVADALEAQVSGGAECGTRDTGRRTWANKERSQRLPSSFGPIYSQGGSTHALGERSGTRGGRAVRQLCTGTTWRLGRQLGPVRVLAGVRRL